MPGNYAYIRTAASEIAARRQTADRRTIDELSLITGEIVRVCWIHAGHEFAGPRLTWRCGLTVVTAAVSTHCVPLSRLVIVESRRAVHGLP